MPDAAAPTPLLSRLAGVVVGVPDPDLTAEFLGEGLGFAVTPVQDGWVAVCDGDYGSIAQAAIELRPASQARLCSVVFVAADPQAIDVLRGRLSAAGVDGTETPAGGLAFADPAGNPIIVEPAGAVVVPPPVASALRPRRLGHLNLKAPDPARAAAFYVDVLGLRRSEQIGDALHFLRIGSEHHNVGLRPGGAGGLHHVGMEIAGWHLYQPILDHLDTAGYTVEYGPGRHRPGNNLFAYVCDPSSGLRVELFADMAHIPDGIGHRPVRWEAGDRMSKTINRWGPTPPESFLA
jgi:catechol 2,3-dioxygenase-like lactoylglutathione lyase family enzyme